jgi:hypothetical protein
MPGLRLTPFIPLVALFFTPFHATHAANFVDPEIILEGEVEGAPISIRFPAILNSPMVFSPSTFVYQTFDKMEPADRPHRHTNRTHTYVFSSGTVTEVRILNEGTPVEDVWVQVTYYWTYIEERTLRYYFDHLDPEEWTETKIQDWLNRLVGEAREGTHTIEWNPDPVSRVTAVFGGTQGPYWGFAPLDDMNITKSPIFEEIPIQVDGGGDWDDENYSEGQQTIREALDRASEKTGDVTIPILISGTIGVDSPLTIPNTGGTITLIPVNGPVTLNGKNKTRILNVPSGASVEFANMSFINGEVSGSALGGAIFNQGTVVLVGCTFEGNEARNRDGGAILNEGTLVADGCDFIRNRAASSAHIGSTGPVNLRDCTFRSGTSTDYGGVTVGASAHLTAVNCLFADIEGYANGNTDSTYGLAVLGTADVSHCSFLGKPALVAGGQSARVTMDHCIVEGLVNEDGAEFRSGGYNLLPQNNRNWSISVWDDDTQQTERFGPTGIVPVFDGSKTLIAAGLSAASKAVNAGKPSFSVYETSPPLHTDVYGQPRIADDRIDIGAMEVDAGTLSTLRWILTDPSKDKNGNGTADTIEALAGHNPSQQVDASPFFDLANAFRFGAGVARRQLAGPASVPNPVIGIPIDERVRYLEGTLQVSEDMVNWTDLATYQPNGSGQGYTRTAHAAGDIVEAEQSGYVWTVFEEIPLDGANGYIRLLAGMRSGPGTPVITSPATASGTLETAFSYQIEAAGATSYEAAGLPAGLSLDSVTGLISGTPVVSGDFEVLLAAYNTSGIGDLFTLSLGIAE